MDAQEAGNGHIHGAQLGSRHAEQQPNTCHLMALRKEASIGDHGKEKHVSQCSVHLPH